jgi:hypothetical protein
MSGMDFTQSEKETINKYEKEKRFDEEEKKQTFYEKIKMYTEDQEKEFLTKLRETSKQCCELVEVQNYIKATLISFIKLLKELGYEIKDIHEKYKNFKLISVGYIDLNDEEFEDYFVNKANSREILFLFYVLIAEIIIFPKLIIYKLSNKEEQTLGINYDCYLLKKIIQDIKIYSGIDKDDVLIDLLSTCNNVDKTLDETNCIGNDMSIFGLSNSLVPPRYTGFPMNPTRISPRFNNIKLFDINNETFCPKLSRKEKNYITQNRGFPAIVSGARKYEIDKNSFFGKLMNKYNEYAMSSPSGITDILFHVFGLFENFDIKLFTLSCISYLCNTPDHSIVEILLVCKTYDNNTLGYSIDIQGGSQKFVEDLIKNIIEKRKINNSAVIPKDNVKVDSTVDPDTNNQEGGIKNSIFKTKMRKTTKKMKQKDRKTIKNSLLPR